MLVVIVKQANGLTCEQRLVFCLNVYRFHPIRIILAVTVRKYYFSDLNSGLQHSDRILPVIIMFFLFPYPLGVPCE